MNWYNKKIEDIIIELETSKTGLTGKEALDRLIKNGSNRLKELRKESNFSKFIRQFKDMMIIILIIAAIFSFVISIINNESFIDSIIILLIVVINAVLGFIQELKADKAVEELKRMQVSKVKVKRENTILLVDSVEIVAGDILVLEAGDKVAADGRIIWSANFKVDESSLTGESLPSLKNTSVIKGEVPLSDRNNMVYLGTNVVYGKALVVVTETGMNTEFGKIASALNEEDDELTPLQIKINEISKVLSILIAMIIIIIFFIGILKEGKLIEVVMLSISLAVAAIPEGLPAVITIILSLGMSSLAKKKAIVRKMSSVETLGSTEIICSDKTGTITQNKMTVKKIYFNNKIYNSDEIIKDNILFEIMSLNNDVGESNEGLIGDPTEIALFNYVAKTRDIYNIRNNHKRINELPFDSDRKLMSTINEYKGRDKLLTKGSFDSLIKRCNSVLENGKVISLTEDKIKKLKDIEKQESSKAYRILAFAYKDLDDKNYLLDDLEKDLTFVGLVCMIDPPREDIKSSIDLCKSAHIKPIMITGDSLDTACAIAKEIGILDNIEEAITGPELDKYSEDELKNIVHKYSVYARVSPINKLSIVNAWKDNNKIVAMTGDGVNDAPALKTADIGVGMGITGTEVSKNVSDIILSDDSFSTIVQAVREGRRIYDNIKKVLTYLLTGNITEVLIVFIGILFGVEIFLPIQLLYINLVTDSIPAIALAFEEEEIDIMNREVRKKDAKFFNKPLITQIIISAFLKTIAIMLMYFIGYKYYSIEIGKTMAFLTLIILEILFAYSCRDLNKPIINKKIFNNSYLNKSTLILIVIQIAVFISPLKLIFNLSSLTYIEFLLCLICCLVVFLLDEIIKPILNRIND